jgi:MADS-box transcription factor
MPPAMPMPMPPAFPSGPDRMPSEGPPRIDTHPASVIQKRAPAKSRSMFTPVGPSDSLLAQHFYGDRVQGSQRSHSVDVATLSRPAANTTVPESTKPDNISESSPKPANTIPPITRQDSIPPPPSRTNSMVSNSGKPGGSRPRLKVQIPSEHSDAGSATGESSAHESSGTTGNHSAKGVNEGGHTVLPPPSPSVGTLLSAGATGPVNPFARPPPTTGPTEQTPISALPSRFVDHGLLPSPSVFYADWPGYNHRATDNILPSPINYTTPVVGTASNIFKDPPESNGKRKSPSSSDHEDEGAISSFQKRVKT